MGLATLTAHVAGTVLTAAALNNNFNAIINQLNGNVETVNMANLAITAAKIATGAVTGPKIAMGSDAQGDILYHNGTNYARLGVGSSGEVLKTLGAGANPAWATVLSLLPAGSIVQVVTTEVASVVTCATTGTTWDDTIPAITDGVQILSRTITPLDASDILLAIITGHAACDSGANHTLHLHKDGGAAVAADAFNVGNHSQNFCLTHSEAAGGTSAQTWTVRLNPSSGGNTSYVNGDIAGTRLFGGVSSAKITIFEIKV